jgi:hypothetical protein
MKYTIEKLADLGIIKVAILVLLLILFCSTSQAEVFKIIHMTDSHVDTTDTRLEDQVAWIKDNSVAENIKFVVNTGDFISFQENGNQTRLDHAALNMRALFGHVPYMVSMGNHDYDTTVDGFGSGKSADNFNNAFPLSDFIGQAGYGGYQPTKEQNKYFTFTAGVENFLILGIDMCPTQDTLDWAEGVFDSNPDKTFILITHSYMSFNPGSGSNNRYDVGDIFYSCGSGTISPEDMYQTLIKNYPDTLLVLSGHSWDMTDPLNNGGARTLDIIDGKAINQLRSNFQQYGNGGGADNTYFRIMTIDTESNLIQVQSYSPANDQWVIDIRDDFYLSRDGNADTDNDGISDSSDNCPNVPNGPSLGTCSLTSSVPGTVCTSNNDGNASCGAQGYCDMHQGNFDADSYGNACDNCPDKCNTQQLDADGDNIGDVCDETPGGCGGSSSNCGVSLPVCDVDCDIDSDGILITEDNCPDTANPGQVDTDNDTIGDVCDDHTVYGNISGAIQYDVTVSIFSNTCGDNILVSTTTTDFEGNYSFGNLSEGIYDVVPSYPFDVFNFVPEKDSTEIPQTEIRSYDFTSQVK